MRNLRRWLKQLLCKHDHHTAWRFSGIDCFSDKKMYTLCFWRCCGKCLKMELKEVKLPKQSAYPVHSHGCLYDIVSAQIRGVEIEQELNDGTYEELG